MVSFLIVRLGLWAFTLLLAPLAASGQILISTGNQSGARIYYPGSNDWWVDPSAGRFDLRVNGGATPVMKVDSAGAVTSSSHTLTGTGTGTPFALTSSSGVHVLSGKLKLEPGAWIEYGDGTVSTSSSSSSGSSSGQVSKSSFTVIPAATVSSNNSYGVCQATVTLTTNASNAQYVVFSGDGVPSVSNAQAGWAFLVDGAFVDGMSTTKGVTSELSAAQDINFSAQYYLAPGLLSSASHNFCLTFAANTGNVTIGFSGGAFSVQPKFGVVEISSAGAAGSSSSGSGSSGTGSSTVGSTQSFIASGSALTNASTFLGCLSTATLTTANNSVFIWGSGSTNPNTTWNNSYIWALFDGQFIGGATGSVPNVQTQAATSGYQTDASFGMMKYGVSAGTHTVCIGASGNGGSASFATVYNYGAYEVPTNAGISGGGNSVSAGQTLQYVSSATSAFFAPVGSAIPTSDAIPTISEGMQILVATITPTAASSSLLIEANLYLNEASNVCEQAIVAFFQDGNANAIQSCAYNVYGIVQGQTTHCRLWTAAGSTTQRNYSVRVGCNAGNVSVNGGSSRQYGGSIQSNLIITEVAPGAAGTANSAAVLSSTQTFTGAQIFTSSITTGNQSYGLALNYNAVIKGGWSIVASTRSAASTSSTFTNYNPNYIHRVHFRCGKSAGAGNLSLRFNSDSGSNYGWHYIQNNSGGGASNNTSNSDTRIRLEDDSVCSNSTSKGQFEIESGTATVASALTTASITGQMVLDNSAAGCGWRTQSIIMGGNYLGSTAINSLTFYNDAVAMDCLIYIEALIPPVDPP